MDKAAKVFFSSPRFAVAGASSDPRKFGHKIFAWYISHSLPATPLNPTSAEIQISNTPYPTVPNVSGLSDPSEVSLSVITPPTVTAKLLREAKGAGVRAVWLQPGSFDGETLEWAKENFPGAAVGGNEDGAGGEGWCVLVHGKAALREAKREAGTL